MQKCQKIKKFKKFITPKLMTVETSGWRHLKEKNKFFLSCEYEKMYHPRQEMAQLSQVQQIKNGKPNFSPTFQKVELQWTTAFSSPDLTTFRI